MARLKEYYSKGKTDDEIAKDIEEFKKFIIIADNAEPKEHNADSEA